MCFRTPCLIVAAYRETPFKTTAHYIGRTYRINTTKCDINYCKQDRQHSKEARSLNVYTSSVIGTT